MTPDVLARKLGRLRTLLADLAPHAGKSMDQVVADHYEIERILELLVQVAVDMVGHDLAERGVVPDTYRSAFMEAGRRELLPEDLAARLADAAGLRNVLVHIYDEIDYEIVTASVNPALEDFSRFADIYGRRLEDEGQDRSGLDIAER